MKTRQQYNDYQREYRQKNNNACTTKYEKTIKGFLMRKYRNMESRVRGIQKLKAHLYKGKYLLPREEYYDWALNNPTFKILWDNWLKNNYDRKLCPTVDRIDSTKGYELPNMHWVTHSVNSSRVSRTR